MMAYSVPAMRPALGSISGRIICRPEAAMSISVRDDPGHKTARDIIQNTKAWAQTSAQAYNEW